MPKARDILVSQHAVDRYRARYSRSRLPFRVAVERIQQCVRDSYESGSVFNHKPDGFILYGEKRKQLEEGQRFVQCSDAYGFIIKSRSEDIVVVTMLSRAGVNK